MFDLFSFYLGGFNGKIPESKSSKGTVNEIISSLCKNTNTQTNNEALNTTEHRQGKRRMLAEEKVLPKQGELWPN